MLVELELGVAEGPVAASEFGGVRVRVREAEQIGGISRKGAGESVPYQRSWMDDGDRTRMESRRRMALDQLRALQRRASSARSDPMAAAAAGRRRPAAAGDGAQAQPACGGGEDLAIWGVGASLCCYSSLL